MKCSQIYFLTVLFAVFLWPVSNQANSKITQDISLLEAIEKISKEYEVYFTFDMNLVTNVRVEYVHDSYGSAVEAIGHILQGTDLKYKFYDQRFVILYKEDAEGLESLKKMSQHLDGLISEGEKTIATSPKKALRKSTVPLLKSRLVSKALEPIDFTVQGTVSDQNGEPLIGVNIQVKGTEQGTATDIDGHFVLEDIDENAVLIVSYIGYQTQEIPVAGKSNLSITLMSDTEVLDELIVVGYRSQARGTVTGSISDLKGEEIRGIPNESLSNALSGRFSGVSVESSAGTPGMESNIRIRAIGTFNNVDPLYVIDGIVSEKYAFDVLSPNEVENITILKDGASASIYGSRAANGVILVTTRRGSTGKPVVNFRSTFSTQNPARTHKKLSAFESAKLINRAIAYHYYYNDNFNVPESDTRLYAPDELDYFKDNEWSWADEMLTRPFTTQQTIDISGGSDIIKYFISGNYNHSSGFLENIDYKKINLRSNVDVNITRDLVMSLNVNNDNRTTSGPAWRYNSGNWAQTDLIKNVWDRNSMTPPSINGLPVGNWVEWSPYAIVDRSISGYDDSEWSGINWTVALDYQLPFVEGLGVNVRYNEYKLDKFRKYFQVPYDMTIFNTLGSHNHIIGNEPVGIRTRDDGEHMYNRNDNNKSYQVNVQLNYKKNIRQHSIDGLFVYEQTESFDNWMQALRYDFISPAVDQFIGGSEENQQATGGEFESARLSYIGALNYSYDNKYLLQGAFRYDGSIIFAPENRWGFFPSASFGWRIDEEPFFHSDFINDIMIRGSIGLLGNDAVGQYQWAQSYILSKGAAFNSVSKGLNPGPIANEDITWEKTLSYNLGVDSRFFNNQFDFKLELFYRHTYDILGRKYESIPSTFGALLPDENYQEIDSKGFEIELGYESKSATSRPFSYSIKGNFGFAVNEVKVKDEAENIRPYQSQIGRPLGEIFGYIATDILRTQADIDRLPEGYTIEGEEPRLGMLNYKDIRGPNSEEPDGRITVDDREWLNGYNIPPINYGLLLGAKWKSIKIDVLLNGFAGNYDILPNRIDARRETLPNAYWKDTWFIDNIDAKYPAARRFSWPPTNHPTSDWFLISKTYLRLKNINVSYNIPSIFSFKNLNIFYNGSNLFFIFDHLKKFGMDPEMNNLSNYPLMTTHSLGVNIILN